MKENNTNKAVFSIKSLLGVFLILISIAGFLGASRGVADNDFAVVLTYIFTFPTLYLGGFVGYWFWTIILFSIGVVIALFRKRIKAKSVFVTFIGILLIYLAGLLLASILVKGSFLNQTSSRFDKFNYETSVKFFNELMFDNTESNKGIWTNRSSNSLMIAYQSGGGLIGFFFSGLLATVGDFLVYIVIVLLALGGLFLTFRKTIINIFKKDNLSQKEKEEPKEDEVKDEDSSSEENKETTASLFLEDKSNEENKPLEETTSNEEEDEIDEPIDYYKAQDIKNEELKEEKEFEYQIKSFNKTHGLSKATLDEDDDLDINNEDSLVSDIVPSINSSLEENEEEDEIFDISNQVAPSNKEEESPLEKQDEIDDYYDFENDKPLEEEKVVEEENKEIIIEPKKEIVLPEIYNYPTSSLLSETKQNLEEIMRINEENCEDRIGKINSLFKRQRIDAYVDGYTIGPCITRFNVAYGDTGLTKHVKAVEKDLSRVLGGYKVRFEEYVLGQDTSGLEIANEERIVVSFKECFEQLPPRTEKNKTMFCLGKDISGKYMNANIAKGPHMLVAGTTGSGKSVFMNSIITTLIMRNSPKELRLIMVDPKRVEMIAYQDLPHLLCPIITDPYKAKSALDKLVKEMDMRYDEFASKRVADIKTYNTKASIEGFEPMPSIICFIDEFADLAENCKDVSRPVALLGGKSRACGIHLVIATQRPTTNIINGTIKGNLPFRVALSVNTATDSVVILDSAGAECLLGNGDMLVSCGEIVPNELIRCQGSFLNDEDRDKVVEDIKSQWPTVYDDFYMNLEGEPKDANAMFDAAVASATNNALGGATISKADALAMDDEVLYKRIKDVAMSRDFISKSYVQSSFNVGFNRAGRMINRLAEEGVISSIPEAGAKGFKVILKGTASSYEDSVNEGSSELVSERYIDDEE